MFTNSDDFVSFIKSRPGIKIGTLGPTGTSSDFALETILSKSFSLDWNKILQNDFDCVYTDLESGHIDIAMIPAAYTNATDFFWSPKFDLAGSFSSPTPDYHLAIDESKNEIHSVASVKAVEGLIDKQLTPHIDCDIEMIYANSTIDAAHHVLRKEADACLTNDYGLQLGSLRVIRTTPGVNMLWSFFSRKHSS